jgi:hypothetical protein
MADEASNNEVNLVLANLMRTQNRNSLTNPIKTFSEEHSGTFAG